MASVPGSNGLWRPGTPSWTPSFGMMLCYHSKVVGDPPPSLYSAATATTTTTTAAAKATKADSDCPHRRRSPSALPAGVQLTLALTQNGQLSAMVDPLMWLGWGAGPGLWSGWCGLVQLCLHGPRWPTSAPFTLQSYKKLIPPAAFSTCPHPSSLDSSHSPYQTLFGNA